MMARASRPANTARMISSWPGRNWV